MNHTQTNRQTDRQNSSLELPVYDPRKKNKELPCKQFYQQCRCPNPHPNRSSGRATFNVVCRVSCVARGKNIPLSTLNLISCHIYVEKAHVYCDCSDVFSFFFFFFFFGGECMSEKRTTGGHLPRQNSYFIVKKKPVRGVTLERICAFSMRLYLIG